MAILLESKLDDNKEQVRQEMHYDFNQERTMNATRPSAPLLYTYFSAVNE